MLGEGDGTPWPIGGNANFCMRVYGAAQATVNEILTANQAGNPIHRGVLA